MTTTKHRIILPILLLVTVVTTALSQDFTWTADGTGIYQNDENGIIRYDLKTNTPTVIVPASRLVVNGNALTVDAFYFSPDFSKVMLFANTRKVWRLNTRGDYWVLDLQTSQLRQLGAPFPPASLMFAKFSPDGKKVAFVYANNLYVEDLSNGQATQLTLDGTRKLINGTFDWVYEEEFACRDGFQWSPDGQHIAFWQIDATRIRDFNMINNTDSVYSSVVPVEYPVAGEDPSAARIGIVSVTGGSPVWIPLPGDSRQHYLPRMEWHSPTSLFVQQLNRKQNESKIFDYDVAAGQVRLVCQERDEAWIDVVSMWENVYSIDFRHRLRWINGNKEFLWFSEKDGWNHLYRISKTGKEVLITKGAYDVIELKAVDEKNNLVYFTASPSDPLRKYLFKMRLDGKGKAEQVTPASLHGTHGYDISPGATYAWHTFTNTTTRPIGEFVSLPNHKPVHPSNSIEANHSNATVQSNVEFFNLTTTEGVEMDGWRVMPRNFDPDKKYPVVFFVYAEPASAKVTDTFGAGRNQLYTGSMADDGYIYISIDNRGTPVPRGRAWRKAIYRQIGRLNIRDQALAAQEVLKWPFVDAGRVAVWGWSGGGSTTLNLLFQYPQIYQTGIAVAAVANQLTYDNIYQERYMGIPQETRADYIAGSPITHAKNLRGNLLYVHGTGDDNVHYSNAEMLINELVSYDKPFQFMAYPNRTHRINEGPGTSKHLQTLYTTFLRTHCPPGPR